MDYLCIIGHEWRFHFNLKILMSRHLMALHAETMEKDDLSRATFKTRFYKKVDFDGLNQI